MVGLTLAMVGRTSMSHHCHVTSQARIIAAVKNIDAPMLTRVWQEIEYRIDVRRVTRGVPSNISSCQKRKFSCLCEQLH
jgi:hypothetical protein